MLTSTHVSGTALIHCFYSVAGSDTSATGIRATMLNIISNPRVYSKLMAEIDATTASGEVPTDLNAVISDAQAKDLPYLQACIKEVRWLNLSMRKRRLNMDTGSALVSSYNRASCKRGKAAYLPCTAEEAALLTP